MVRCLCPTSSTCFRYRCRLDLHHGFGLHDGQGFHLINVLCLIGNTDIVKNYLCHQVSIWEIPEQFSKPKRIGSIITWFTLDFLDYISSSCWLGLNCWIGWRWQRARARWRSRGIRNILKGIICWTGTGMFVIYIAPSTGWFIVLSTEGVEFCRPFRYTDYCHLVFTNFSQLHEANLFKCGKYTILYLFYPSQASLDDPTFWRAASIEASAEVPAVDFWMPGILTQKILACFPYYSLLAYHLFFFPFKSRNINISGFSMPKNIPWWDTQKGVVIGSTSQI